MPRIVTFNPEDSEIGTHTNLGHKILPVQNENEILTYIVFNFIEKGITVLNLKK